MEEHPTGSDFHNNAVFFIEVEKIHPNPYQPRREFDQARLEDLADSIKMYGVLQPLVVTRKEVLKDDGGLTAEYELIAGERRLRASKLAGLREVPALIRSKKDDEKTKLELAIIENLQREDLNPIDRALAFQQLAEKFGFKHSDIAKKVGKSREYVSNSVRVLILPDEIKEALANKKISEGHARPLLMLADRPEEQNVLFKEILLRKMTVRDAEKISRKIAYDKVRKKERMFDPDIVEMEEGASQKLGARVTIEPKEVGGRVRIDYLDDNELRKIMLVLNADRSPEDQLTKEDLIGGIVNSRGEIGQEDEVNEDKQQPEEQESSDQPEVNEEVSENENIPETESESESEPEPNVTSQNNLNTKSDSSDSNVDDSESESETKEDDSSFSDSNLYVEPEDSNIENDLVSSEASNINSETNDDDRWQEQSSDETENLETPDYSGEGDDGGENNDNGNDDDDDEDVYSIKNFSI